MEIPKHSLPWEADAAFRMIDVGQKAVTRRVAVAQGTIVLSSESYAALAERRNPKGDVLALAEMAGITAAKKTADLIPLCHPLPLDQIRLSFRLLPEVRSVVVFCEVVTHAKTGVEMEALVGVQGALLTIYDLSKAVDPVLKISEVRLNTKEGGKHGAWRHPEFLPAPPSAPASARPSLAGRRCAVLTISDRVARRETDDVSGPALISRLKDCAADIVGENCVPDDVEAIAGAVRALIRDAGAEVVLSTGGTGLGPRDVTPEAMQKVITRFVPGIGELLRRDGARHTKMSWLSRSCAGFCDGALVIALPGSPKAVVQGFAVLEDLIPHILHISAGGGH